VTRWGRTDRKLPGHSPQTRLFRREPVRNVPDIQAHDDPGYLIGEPNVCPGHVIAALEPVPQGLPPNHLPQPHRQGRNLGLDDVMLHGLGCEHRSGCRKPQRSEHFFDRNSHLMISNEPRRPDQNGSDTLSSMRFSSPWMLPCSPATSESGKLASVLACSTVSGAT